MGDIQALDIYRELLSITNKIVSSLDDSIERLVFYSDSIAYEDLWSENRFVKKLQYGNDLGQRMEQAFQIALEHHDHVIIIGSDCPYITKNIIETCFFRLEDNDVVIGPTNDGGYYLLGMNNLHKNLFRGIEWSTEFVFKQTKSILAEHGLKYWQAPMLSDIDFEQDWLTYLQKKE